MSLKLKTIIAFLCVFIAFAAANLLVYRMIIFPKFVELENEEIQKDAQRAIHAIHREIEHLDQICHDWSAWDDTHAFAETRAEDYINDNFPENLYEDLRLNLVCIFDKEGRLLFGQHRKAGSYEPFETPISDNWPVKLDDFSLVSQAETRAFGDIKITGIYITDQGPMIVASRPILSSMNQGPINGTLIMGRVLDPAFVKSVAEQANISLEIKTILNVVLPMSLHEIVSRISPKSPFWIERNNPDNLSCFAVFSDIEGRPALLLTVKSASKISATGASAIGYAWLLNSLSAVAVLLVALWMLQRAVVGPVTRLSEHALSIGNERNLSKGLNIPKTDEIGRLEYILDKIVAHLDDVASQLAKSEEMYRLITEHALSVVLLFQNGILIYANRKAVELSGYSPEEIMYMPTRELMHPEDLQRLEEIRQIGQTPVSQEIRYLTRSGQTRWLEMLSVPIVYNNADTTLIHGIDITDKKKIQMEQKEIATRLQRAEKMEMIGAIVGGVAHDLNNILSGLITYPELILIQMPADSPYRNALNTIRQSGKKAEAIVQDLLTLSRRGVACSEAVCLNEIVATYLDSPEHHKIMSFNTKVQVITNLDENLLNIMGSPVHLSKTLMNLASNAVESMAGGGTLSISTENCYLDYPLKGYNTVKEGDYVRLTVSDTGTGIGEEDREKIFEPFYTKKVMGKSGTGLGLAVVWSTVKDHQGYIQLESVIGKGSSFHLYFPVTLKIAQRTAPAVSLDRFRGNGEKILVVDDVSEQREIAAEMLKALGYHAASVPNGEAALEYLAHSPADLILLDMIMDPGMDGLETYRRILKIRPGQKAIIVSGYSETDRVSEVKSLGAVQYIKKPYMLEKIGLAIRRELEKPE